MTQRKHLFTAAIFALVFAAFQMSGAVCAAKIAGEGISLVTKLVTFVISAAVCFAVVYAAYAWFEKRAMDSKHSAAAQSLASKLSSKFIFVCTFCAVIICWSPYIVATFPGCDKYDGVIQLMQYYGSASWSGHHPVVATLIMGFITNVGRHLTGSSVGAIFAYVLFITLLEAACCALITVRVVKLSQSTVLMFATVVFYAVLPIFGTEAQFIWKDNLSMCLFALYFLQLLQVFCADYPSRPRNWVLLGVFGLLLALTRKEMIIVVVITAVLGLILRRKAINVRAAIACAVSVFLAFVLVNNVIIPAAGVTKGSFVEGLSFPMQQVTYMVKYEPDLLSNEQVEMFDQCFWATHDQVIDAFDLETSDPIKGWFEPSEASTLFRLYAQLWIAHPVKMIQAVYVTTFEYFYVPTSTVHYTTISLAKESTLSSPLPYEFSQPTAPVYNAMNAWSHFWQETPVLQQLILPAIYVWIMAAALVYGLATRRRKVVVACVPLLLVLAAGCFSPVDGYTRYMLPLFICVPLLVALCKAPNSIDKNEYTTPENLKNAEGVTSLSLTA